MSGSIIKEHGSQSEQVAQFVIYDSVNNVFPFKNTLSAFNTINDIIGNTYTGIPQRSTGWVPDHHNK